ncbi:hypothetical protein F4X33_10535 [Candidatus Poribacteria bacterium]|nr:hypothetical protein [Candidatus Poribacteria bacterium]
MSGTRSNGALAELGDQSGYASHQRPSWPFGCHSPPYGSGDHAGRAACGIEAFPISTTIASITLAMTLAAVGVLSRTVRIRS